MNFSLHSGATAVWQRNFQYFKKALVASFFWSVVEPLVYFFAVGWGVGQFVGQMEGVSYAAFFCPALVVTSAMIVSYMENTYGSFTKLTHQKTFSAILLSPLTAREIAFGEILWGASKGMFSACAVTLVGTGFNLIPSWLVIPGLGFAFLTAWFFSALGLLVSTMVKTYDSFTYTISGFIVPMSLFSATYFPMSGIPEWLRPVTYLLPLTHAVLPARDLFLGKWEPTHLIHAFVLFVASALITRLAAKRLEKKIVS